jgi:hypothetical protein
LWVLAGRKRFFFEKKNQKTFAIKEIGVERRVRKVIKVFCFFSSKKKALPCKGTRLAQPA